MYTQIQATFGTEVERTDKNSIFGDEESLTVPLTDVFTEASSYQSDTNVRVSSEIKIFKAK